MSYEYMGSWSFHVASWMSVTSRPVLILRYEDLLCAPERNFGRVASFLRLQPTTQQLRRAIEKSPFRRAGAARGGAWFYRAAGNGGEVFPQGRGGAMEGGAVASTGRGGGFRPCADDAAIWLSAGGLRGRIVKWASRAASRSAGSARRNPAFSHTVRPEDKKRQQSKRRQSRRCAQRRQLESEQLPQFRHQRQWRDDAGGSGAGRRERDQLRAQRGERNAVRRLGHRRRDDVHEDQRNRANGAAGVP